MDRSSRPSRHPRTSRRRFAGASIASIATTAVLPGLAAPAAFAGQSVPGTPDTPDIATETILDLSALEGFVAGAAREFYLSASGLGELFGSAAIAVLGAGVRFENEDAASAALTGIRGAVPEALEGVIGSANSGTKRSSAGELGDENLGLVLTFPFPPESETNEVDAGVTIVRKGADVQVIVNVAYVEALEGAIALAQAIDGRWPSDDLLDLVPSVEEAPAPLVLRAEATL